MVVPATVADITAGQSLNAHQVSIGTVASTPSLFGNKEIVPITIVNVKIGATDNAMRQPSC